MRNVSCYRFPFVDTMEFGETWEQRKVEPGLGRDGSLFIRVWDPDGREIPRENFKPESPESFLYGPDPEALRRQVALQGDKKLGFELLPGAAIASVPSVLAPRVLERATDPSTMAQVGRYVSRPIPKGAEPPPNGFTILDMFVFDKPGTYSIQAVYEEVLDAEPILPYAGRVPRIFQIPTALLGGLGLRLDPDPLPLIGHKFLVHAESEKLDFTVNP
ncbi:MAG: hypothetical protein HYV15_01760 [Elusimicrobia bacterium]|nr:hypothetical protein [Elusimicrobiota bacterium]